ncbi:hypothetical protein GCM10025791_21450 [Halioxenophilus aromaticivorans]|uniref:Malonyl-[acyl-carrier protein] O-methyltransferase n=2 Tax=Halioxenophilus aromaticivorans TaxID=1306992 RepID=A0AAV3U238_9ALTE
MLHGWGGDSRAWQDFAYQLNQHFHLHILDLPGFGGNRHAPVNHQSLIEMLPQRCYLLGWSLGGMVAVQLAAGAPDKIAGVITLAANAKFVASDDWPTAMAKATFEQFYSGASRSLQTTLKRFAPLVGNDLDKTQLAQLRSDLMAAQKAYPDAAYMSGLNWLQTLDNRESLAQMAVPSLHLLGEHDQLVPATAAQPLAKLLIKAPVVGAVELIQCGHALHLAEPQAVEQKIVQFIGANQPNRDKQKVADSFSRAAPTYDSVAQLQRKVGARLSGLFRRSIARRQVDSVLDLGSGTGIYSKALAELLPDATVVSTDFAQGMLQYARSQQQGELFCVGDAEQLPFADDSFSALFSSLMVQWCENTATVLAEIYRVLKPGGCAVIATLGPGTLYELNHAWAQVDDDQHVNKFTSAKVWLMQAAQLGYARVEYKKEPITQYYDNVRDLTHSLKALGARNVNIRSAAGLGGRQKIAEFTRAYETQRTQHGLPLSYQVDYFILEK